MNQTIYDHLKWLPAQKLNCISTKGSRDGHLGDQFFCALGAKPWYHSAEPLTLSRYIHYVAQLFLAPQIIYLRRAQLNLQTYILIQRRCLLCQRCG